MNSKFDRWLNIVANVSIIVGVIGFVTVLSLVLWTELFEDEKAIIAFTEATRICAGTPPGQMEACLRSQEDAHEAWQETGAILLALVIHKDRGIQELEVFSECFDENTSDETTDWVAAWRCSLPLLDQIEKLVSSSDI